MLFISVRCEPDIQMSDIYFLCCIKNYHWFYKFDSTSVEVYVYISYSLISFNI